MPAPIIWYDGDNANTLVLEQATNQLTGARVTGGTATVTAIRDRETGDDAKGGLSIPFTLPELSEPGYYGGIIPGGTGGPTLVAGRAYEADIELHGGPGEDARWTATIHVRQRRA